MKVRFVNFRRFVLDNSLRIVAFISFFICLVLIAYFFNIVSVNSDITAKNGKLDLSKLDFKKNVLYELKGEWRFYWRKFITHNIKERFFLFNVPDVWNNLLVNNKRLTGDGFGTFVLDIKVPIADTFNYALYIPEMGTSYRLFIDNKMVGYNGKVGTNSSSTISEYKRKIVNLGHSKHRFSLFLQIANFISDKGGPWNSIIIGKEENVRKFKDIRLIFQAFVLGIIFIMIMVNLFLFLLQLRCDRKSLIFSFFLISIFVLTLLSNEILSYFSFLKFTLINRIANFAVIFSFFLFLLYLKALFPNEFNIFIINFLIKVSFLISVLYLFFPLKYINKSLFFVHLYIILATIILILIFIRTLQRKRKGSAFISIGILLLFLGIINDVLSTLIVLQTEYFLSYCVVVFIVINTMVLVDSSNVCKTKFDIVNLSMREKEVALLLVNGLAYKEIARKLHISYNTVKKHIDKIYEKLGVHDKISFRNKLLE